MIHNLYARVQTWYKQHTYTHTMPNATQTDSRLENSSSFKLASLRPGRDPTLYPPHSIATLPEELLREVFLHCLPTDEFVRPRRTSAPLLLCQVCCAWRASAIATPELWASIAVGSHFDKLGRFPRVELLDLWLERAKNRPLSISFGRYGVDSELPASPVGHGPAEEELTNFFRILFGRITQWKSLRLCPRDIDAVIPAIPQSGAPLLQKLCLFLPQSIKYEDYELLYSADQNLYNIWCNSTLLDTFCLYADDIYLQNGDEDSLCKLLHIRWGQLTTLTITASQTVAQCLEFLKECPSLVDCVFHYICADDDDDDNDIFSALYPSTILCTSLKSLSLRYSGPASDIITDLLLTNTTFPALRQLTLCTLQLFSLDPFAAFISRSSCHIEDLTLHDVFINEACFLLFLELISPTLVRLCIWRGAPIPNRIPGKYISETILHRLTKDDSYSRSPVILCPKLESVDLDYRAVTARDGLFAKMVSSRFGMEQYGITALKRVVLRFGRSFDICALKQLEDEGVIEELEIIGG